LKKFTIILNSRKRFLYLENLLNSIKNTTSNLSDIEVLISCDSDDDSTSVFWQNNSSQWPWAFCEFIEREKNLTLRFNNIIKNSEGKYIFILNDDCEILTPDWEIDAFDKLEQYEDNIIYGRTQDNSCDKVMGGPYASFPIVSKRSTDILGFFMHTDFPGLGGDVTLYRIYNEIDRIIDLNVHINHVLHTTVEKVMNPDETASEMRQTTYNSYVNEQTFDISKDVEKLRKHVNHYA